MKFIAFYLPQFHSIPENDKWWGAGFTEWFNTKKAIPMFDGHYQPRTPCNNNYYNLLDVKTLKFQADLANKHEIYGFCIYHYWFNGRKLLEKPAEILLNAKDIDAKYCFSWANEPWSRAWDGKDSEVLIPQKYGGEDEWRQHFDYLLPFFQDERYIRIDNKPVFVIYRTNNIPNVEEMLIYWDKLSQKNGINGLCIIETLNSFQNKPILNKSEGAIEFEPMYTLRQKSSFFFNLKRYFNKRMGRLDIVDYDSLWARILKRKINANGKRRFLGAFVDWDNTARKGKNGLIVRGATPEKFGRYLKNQSNKSVEEYIFVNAWNEWAEGAYLEPDKKYNLAYLQQVKKVGGNLDGG